MLFLKNKQIFSEILYMSDSDRGCGCRWYGAKSFEGSAAAFSASFCRFIFLGLRFTSAMMPVWSNSLMAIRSISFWPFLSHQLRTCVYCPDSITLSWKYCSSTLPE